MVRLTILGETDLRRDDGTSVGSVLAQPRRYALLVYLVLEADGGSVQRDNILGVFWPDLPQKKARQALRTALHFLRRSLGREAIVSRGGALEIDPERLSCDALDFRAGMLADSLEDALRHYGGDLLPGFYLDGGPLEFERWLEEKRRTLRRQAADAAWKLAEDRESRGNHPAAGSWARKAAELAEGDEPAVRRAMELLGRIGDRAGALSLYEALTRRLRGDYETEPSPETDAVLARLRENSGSVAHEPGSTELEESSKPGDADPEPATPAGPGGPRWVSRSFGRRIGSGVATLVLLAGFYSLWGLTHPTGPRPGPDASERPVLLIEPIRAFSGNDDLAGALTLEVTARLGEVERFVVLGDRTGRAPHYVLRAGLVGTDSVARVNAILVDDSSGATLHRVTAEQPLRGNDQTVAGLADALALQVRRQLGRAVAERGWRSATGDGRALELVRQAVEDIATSDSLERAGAPGAAGVALAAADSQLALAQAAAPRWSEPSVQRAEVALERMWLHVVPPAVDRRRARQALREGVGFATDGLRIAPNDPAAHELRGVLRYWLVLNRPEGTPPSRETLALAETDLRRATRLDPARTRAWSFLSTIHERRGEFAAANLAARRAYAADAFLENASDILLRLFTTSLEIGDEAAADRWCEEINRRMGGSWVGAYCDLERLAWGLTEVPAPERLRERIDEATASAAGRHVRPRLEMLAAIALARAGREVEAREWIDAATRTANGDPHLLQVEARARLALGDHSAARALAQRAITANPRTGATIKQSRQFAALGL